MAQGGPTSSTEAVRIARQRLVASPLNDVELVLSQVAVTDFRTLIELLAEADQLPLDKYIVVLDWAFLFQEWVDRQAWHLRICCPR